MPGWQKAAQKYREATAEFKTERVEEELKRAAQELESFLMSADGKAGLELLRASKQFIRFGESEPGAGFTLVYILDADGLHCSSEASGSWPAYSKSVPKPKFSALSCFDAVRIATSPARGKMKPGDVLDWLRAELDRIADAAPKK